MATLGRPSQLKNWLKVVLVVCGIGILWLSWQTRSVAEPRVGPIVINAVAVPLNPVRPSDGAIGEFSYAGGLALTSLQTDRLHGLSDIVVSGSGSFTAVGDEGILLQARLVLDASERLVGVADARLSLLTGEDGKPLSGKTDADAEGLAEFPNGDRLVSFERRHRIWLYPANGGRPHAVASPDSEFPSNAGMEALAVDPDAGPGAYVTGAEGSGRTWTCVLDSPTCVPGPDVEMAKDFALVALARLPNAQTAYLLRALHGIGGSRITLEILGHDGLVARMDMARPMTVDNFEGLAAQLRPDGRVRFYLISDDSGSARQRTLLLAFDWRPR